MFFCLNVPVLQSPTAESEKIKCPDLKRLPVGYKDLCVCECVCEKVSEWVSESYIGITNTLGSWVCVCGCVCAPVPERKRVKEKHWERHLQFRVLGIYFWISDSDFILNHDKSTTNHTQYWEWCIHWINEFILFLNYMWFQELKHMQNCCPFNLNILYQKFTVS